MRKTNQEKLMSRDLTANLAGLLSVTGRLLTLIRARGWGAERDAGEAPEAVRDVIAWADAAHNLSALGHLLRSHATGEEGDPERLLREGRHLAGAMRSEADRSADRAPLVAETLREAADLIDRIRGAVAPPPRMTKWACSVVEVPLACRIEHGHLAPEARVDSVPTRHETVLLTIEAEGLLPSDTDSGDLANFWNYARLLNGLSEGGVLVIRDALERVADRILAEVREDLSRLPLRAPRASVTLSRGELIPGARVLIRAETDDTH
jgi:hypothetical protein